MKKLVLLGSTGSIGTQTLNVIDHLKPEQEWHILALSANTNYKLLAEQTKKYRPDYVVLGKEDFIPQLKTELAGVNVKILSGIEGLKKIAAIKADLVINALVGAAGLEPSIAALKRGNNLGLANKESLVIGGHLLNQLCTQKGGEILPIDSEHNAVFHLLADQSKEEIDSIVLTASGGPFFQKPLDELKKVSVEEALDHPNWDMGRKITIDSATMMNKGLEVIEAHWLFNKEYKDIRVIIHPESIIHSMVELVDGTLKADMGPADMRIPIQSVLTYPRRKNSPTQKLDLTQVRKLTFHSPDFERFPLLKLAYQAGEVGGSNPVVLNAANEVAVRSFLEEKISFLDIARVVESMLDAHEGLSSPNLDEIKGIDRETRKKTEEALNNVDYSN